MQLDGQFANERFTQETEQQHLCPICKSMNFDACDCKPDYACLRIKVEYVYPPIPIRSLDYLAVDDATYDGPGSLTGEGPTAQAAMLDLITKISERDDTDPLQILLEMAHANDPQEEMDDTELELRRKQQEAEAEWTEPRYEEEN